jgi:hypothetical protein
MVGVYLKQCLQQRKGSEHVQSICVQCLPVLYLHHQCIHLPGLFEHDRLRWCAQGGLVAQEHNDVPMSGLEKNQSAGDQQSIPFV